MPYTFTTTTATTAEWISMPYITTTSTVPITFNGGNCTVYYEPYVPLPNNVIETPQSWLPLAERDLDSRELAEQERLDRTLRERQEERIRARRVATDTAEALLLSVLDEVQAADYRLGRAFEVIGSSGGRYVINYGTEGNVDALTRDGEEIGTLCCHPRGGLPTPDVMLAQMLALVTDEPAFVRTANVYRGRRPVIEAVDV